MKTIGILGGMSAASTLTYFRILCDMTRERLGERHSPELLIRAVDFARIEAMQAGGQWEEAGRALNEEAIALERGGAELLLLATNTMHKVADAMMTGVSVPLIHIADTAAHAINDRGFKSPGLMATAFTMEQSFYRARLRSFGLQPVVPGDDDRIEIHRIIYDELCRGIATRESETTFVAIADRLVQSGADSLILGCTEVGMLLNESNVSVPVFDTTPIHCAAALEAALT